MKPKDNPGPSRFVFVFLHNLQAELGLQLTKTIPAACIAPSVNNYYTCSWRDKGLWSIVIVTLPNFFRNGAFVMTVTYLKLAQWKLACSVVELLVETNVEQNNKSTYKTGKVLDRHSSQGTQRNGHREGAHFLQATPKRLVVPH